MGGLLYLSFKHNIFRYFRNENTLFQGNKHPCATLFQGNEVCRWGYKALAIGGERVKKADGKERREVALAPLPALGAAGHAMGVLTRMLAFGPEAQALCRTPHARAA